jgi:hypothetical protein
MAMRLVDKVLLVASVLAIAGVAYLGIVQYQNESDRTYWRDLTREEVFDYKSIDVQNEYKIGEPVIFKSNSVHIADITFNWNDVLRCMTSESGGYEFFSNYDSSFNASKPKTEYESGDPWHYNAATPNAEVECILDSNIKVTTPYGYQHTQSLRTEPFKFVK